MTQISTQNTDLSKQGLITPVEKTMEESLLLAEIEVLSTCTSSDKLFCRLHGYAYCYAKLLNTLPGHSLIEMIWIEEMHPKLINNHASSQFERFQASFQRMFYQTKFDLHSNQAVLPYLFHQRPSLIIDDQVDHPLDCWLKGVAMGLSTTKQVPQFWIKKEPSEFGEMLLEAMIKTVNEFCIHHGINLQFAVDIVFDRFQTVIDEIYDDSE